MQKAQWNMPFFVVGILALVACWHVFAFFSGIRNSGNIVQHDDEGDELHEDNGSTHFENKESTPSDNKPNRELRVKATSELESRPRKISQQTSSSILVTRPDDVKQRLGKSVVRPIADTVRMPTFAMRTTMNMTLPPNYSRRQGMPNEALKFWRHPNRIEDENQADFVMHIVETIFFDKEDPHPIIDTLEALPQRSPKRPHVVWLHWTPFDAVCAPYGRDIKPQFFPDSDPFCVRAKKVLYDRDDMLFVGFDLGNHIQRMNNCSLKEVTEAPGSPEPWPVRFNLNPEVPAKYLLTFKGSISAGRVFYNPVRVLINQSFGRMHEEDPSVQVHIAKSRKAKDAYPPGTPSYQDLMNSSYVFILRGDQRWSYRFSEVIGACSIPVIMSDGITLPYAELIDWSQAAIQVPEALANDSKAVLDLLPRDPNVIRVMRRNICTIRDRFWHPRGALEDSFLRSVGVLIEQAEM